MARGHRVDNVPELPLVIDNVAASNTKAMFNTLQTFGCGDDLAKVRKSRALRAGRGKYRNSRYTLRKGPLVIYGDDSTGVK